MCPAVSVAGTMQQALLKVRDVGHGRWGTNEGNVGSEEALRFIV